MKRKAITAAVMALAIAALQITVPVSADFYSDYGFASYEEWSSFVLGRGFSFIDDSYDVLWGKNTTDDIDSMAWIPHYDNNLGGYSLEPLKSGYPVKYKVPNSYKFEEDSKKTVYVKRIEWSCPFKEFDLDPNSKYLKLIDNVVFSKDGKTLMSYAQYDERTVYKIPYGTEIVSYASMISSENLVEIIIPDSVKELGGRSMEGIKVLEKVNIPPLVEELPNYIFSYDSNLKDVYIPENSQLKKIGKASFAECMMLTELTLPSFDIEISRTAFAVDGYSQNVTLKSYVKPEAKATYSNSTGVYKLKWSEVPNADHYEIYQKLRDGSYKLLKTTKGTSIKFADGIIKSGKKYTLAVKPIAKIEASGEKDEYVDFILPEYYTIEGTMSDDVTFVGK